MHGDDTNVTLPVGVVKMNETKPCGVLAVPIPPASDTVAVQVVADPVLTDDGVHDTEVVVGRLFTVIVVLPVLPEWLASPPYVPGMFNAGPAKGGVVVIVHAADDPVPERVQLRPTPADTAATPVGVIAVPVSVSDTVNVHVVGWPTVTVDGEQFIVMLVARLFTVIELLAPLLPEWTVSPG